VRWEANANEQTRLEMARTAMARRTSHCTRLTQTHLPPAERLLLHIHFVVLDARRLKPLEGGAPKPLQLLFLLQVSREGSFRLALCKHCERLGVVE
jgi:hypothetical protein